MKPCRIIICAFGPFGSKVEIPMEQIKQGLFLVTGNTGAGKTTLFDAICFALFGEVSGSMRTVDSLRSDFAKADEKTYVELEFLHRGQKYQIYRNPRYQRTKRNGTGFTTESADAVLTVTNKNVITGYRAVTEAVQDLLGLDINQFKQVVMIAQGEFLKLLLADNDDRGSLLRKIFHTEQFLKMQNILKEQEKNCKYEYEESTKNILLNFKDISCPETVEIPELAEENRGNIYQSESILDALRRLLSEDKEKLEQFAVHKAEIEKGLQDISQQLLEGQYRNQLIEQWETIKKEGQTLENKKPEVELAEKNLVLWTKALTQVYPVEQLFCREKQEEISLLNSQKNLQKRIEELMNLYLEKKKLVEEIQKTYSETGNMLGEIDKEESLLTVYDEKQKIEVQLKQISLQSEEMLKELEQSETLLKNTVEKQERMHQQLESWVDIELQYTKIENQINTIVLKEEKLVKWKDMMFRMQEGKRKYLHLQHEYTKNEEVYNRNKQRHDLNESNFLREQAGILAEKLIDNEPCPVCGSKEHPQKAVFSGNSISEDELKSEKLHMEEEKENLYTLASQCNELKTKLTAKFYEVQEQAKEYIEDIELWSKDEYVEGFEKEIEKVRVEKSTLGKVKKQLQRDISTKQEMQKQNVVLEKYRKELEEKKTLLFMEHGKQKVSFAAKETELHGLEKQLTYSSKEKAIQVLKEKKEQYQRLNEALEHALEEYNHCQSELEQQKVLSDDIEKRLLKHKFVFEKAKKEFEMSLLQEGFSSEDEYRQCLYSQEILDKTKKEIDEFWNLYNKNQHIQEQLIQSIKDREKVDLENLKHQKSMAEQEKKEIELQSANIPIRYTINETVLKKAVQELKNREILEKKLALTQELSKTACGELGGKQKIRFEQYIQAFYFERIIEEANQRLFHMTNGRYELLRQEYADNLRSQSGLGLEVMDYYTGKKRSVKSLSGGEAFKSSLALALGLSDIIQNYAGGIEIDTMFIDEGFGTLDEESLEQAIETLNSLTYGNRLVGIISHVTELKERIEKQIVVQKGNCGSDIKIIV